MNIGNEVAEHNTDVMEPQKLRGGRLVLWATALGSLAVALAVFIFLGYYFGWEWTGFPPKRLFDWVQILVIPVAVAVGTFILTRTAKRRDDAARQAQKEREETSEAQRAEEASLQEYLNYISKMLTDPDRPLRRSHVGDNLSVVARAQTLTVLGMLQDGGRKSSVLQFLYEAGLISKNYPLISLQGAYLQETNLFGLFGADLREANLQRANLYGANLQSAINLTQKELEKSIGDENTKLPECLERPKFWTEGEGNQRANE